MARKELIPRILRTRIVVNPPRSNVRTTRNTAGWRCFARTPCFCSCPPRKAALKRSSDWSNQVLQNVRPGQPTNEPHACRERRALLSRASPPPSRISCDIRGSDLERSSLRRHVGHPEGSPIHAIVPSEAKHNPRLGNRSLSLVPGGARNDLHSIYSRTSHSIDY